MWMLDLERRPEHACRECTLPRDNPDSELLAWIGGHTRIGKVRGCLDHYGFEIQAPSTSGDGSNSWVIKSRGSNRYVEELQGHGPDNSHGSRANCESYKRREIAHDILKHEGKSCVTTENTIESDEQPFRRL